MSDTIIKVKFEHNHVIEVLYGRYDGISDIAYNDLQEAPEGWSELDNNNECICGNDEEVIIATEYGHGYYWSGRACKKCKCITDGFDPYEAKWMEDGKPGWWYEIEKPNQKRLS